MTAARTSSVAQRVELSDEVQRAVAQSDDLNEAFALLEAASEFYRRHQRPMTMADYESRSPA